MRKYIKFSDPRQNFITISNKLADAFVESYKIITEWNTNYTKKGHLSSEKEQLIEIFNEDLNSEHLESNSTKKMAFKHLRSIDDKIYIVMEDFSIVYDVKNEDQTANSRKIETNMTEEEDFKKIEGAWKKNVETKNLPTIKLIILIFKKNHYMKS